MKDFWSCKVSFMKECDERVVKKRKKRHKSAIPASSRRELCLALFPASGGSLFIMQPRHPIFRQDAAVDPRRAADWQVPQFNTVTCTNLFVDSHKLTIIMGFLITHWNNSVQTLYDRIYHSQKCIERIYPLLRIRLWNPRKLSQVPQNERSLKK